MAPVRLVWLVPGWDCALSMLPEPQTPHCPTRTLLPASATGSAGMVPEGAGDRVRHSPKRKGALREDKRKSTRARMLGAGVPVPAV